jgi:xanthine dehydrogenase YagR molybdenum-binding subunit
VNMTTPFTGQTVDRVDGKLKVTGRALYAADHPVENLCHGYLIQSSIPRGAIASMDVTEAQASPGVLAIFTPFNPLKLYMPLGQGEGAISGDFMPLLQNPEIHYFGQTIGLVVAESFEQARDAAALVKVDYQTQPAVIDVDAGLGQAYAPKSVNDLGATVTVLADGVSSVDAALGEAEVSVSGTYSNPIEHHNPMEPHATTALWNENRLTIYDATQWVQGQQRNLAAVLGVDEADVRVICPFVGGGFGCKGSMWMHSPLTAAAARVLNRPVKTVLTRGQMFTAVGHRPIVKQTVTLGANRDGTLAVIKHEAVSSTSRVKLFVESAAHRTSLALYKAPNIQVSHRVVPLDVAPGTFMRAPGVAPGMFALESAMDELAVKLGMDPVELRLRNYATVDPNKKLPWSSKHLDECYRVGAEKFGWSERHSEPATARDGDWLVGTGMATALYPAHRSKAEAKLRLEADGTASISSATHDLGTGMYTVLAIVASQSLGIPVNRIRPVLGDSALSLSPVAGGSQSTASVGPAVLSAVESAKKRLIAAAIAGQQSPLFGMKADQVAFENGELRAGAKSIPFAQVLAALGRASIDGSGTASPGEEEHQYAFLSFGAQFCEVRVNQWTGEARVSRFTSVMDIGTVVSSKTARSQVIGGIVFGIGMGLLEATQVDPRSGWIANRNIAEYLVPTNADVPKINVELLNFPDTVFNPLGARGIGEIGIAGVPAAIANAVFNATGKRVRDLPIRPESLLPEPGHPNLA